MLTKWLNDKIAEAYKKKESKKVGILKYRLHNQMIIKKHKEKTD